MTDEQREAVREANRLAQARRRGQLTAEEAQQQRDRNREQVAHHRGQLTTDAAEQQRDRKPGTSGTPPRSTYH